jgi:hypothetical protein
VRTAAKLRLADTTDRVSRRWLRGDWRDRELSIELREEDDLRGSLR